MGFWEKLLGWIGFVEEVEEETAAAWDEEGGVARRDPPSSFTGRGQQGERRLREKGKLVGLPGKNGPLRVVVVDPQEFDEVQGIADHLKERRPVIVNLEGADHELARRIIDFLIGVVYALDGNVQRIGEEVFLFTPSNIFIEASQLLAREEGVVFPWMRREG